MLGGFLIGATARQTPGLRDPLDIQIALTSDRLRIRLRRAGARMLDELALSALEIDGESVMAAVTDPASPQLAATPQPGRIDGNGRIVSALTEPPEVGALYLVSYEILEDHGVQALYFSDANGCPFPNTVALPLTVGRHTVLVEAKDNDSAALMRLTGDLTFGTVSCRKAEWSLALPDGQAHSETALRGEPGRVQGTDASVSALNPSLDPGVPHILRYEIRAADRNTSLYLQTGAGSPPEKISLPVTPGHHSITVRSEAHGAADAVRLTGDLTFGHLSCRRAGGAGGRQIVARVQSGSAQAEAVFYTPDPGVLYVAPSGDDATGTGALRSPFATPARALQFAGPGDTIYLRPGLYAPFEVTASGAPDQPLIITTLPGEERLAIVEGDLMRHARFGGPGVAQDAATRDGIYIPARDHVHVRNLTIRNVWRAGIFVVGTEGETHGNHVLAGNRIRITGSSGIFVGGNNSSEILPLTETGTMRTDNVLIEHNDVSETNVVTDYNDNSSNPQGVPGGVAEAISVAAGVSNAVTRFNDVHDTRQYGIDYKAGVRGGAIHDNRVWNVERYGIYLDAGRRFVEDVTVHGNRIWNCRMGIVLAREAGSNTVDYATLRSTVGSEQFVQTLARIDVYNNVVRNADKAGLFCQRHTQKDGPDGAIRDVRIRFNTVHNANRDGTARDLNLSGWSDPDFVAAGVASGIEFIGNLVWNDTSAVNVLDEFSGKAGFSVSGNLIGIDPGFVAPDAAEPDLTPLAGSPAEGLVAEADVAAPFDLDIGGADRSAARAAGAYAPG